jgi:uncharacterized membrane protein YoaK (UPF0700 family)
MGIFYSLTIAGIAVGAPISGFIFQFLGDFYLYLFAIALPLIIMIVSLIGERKQ